MISLLRTIIFLSFAYTLYQLSPIFSITTKSQGKQKVGCSNRCAIILVGYIVLTIGILWLKILLNSFGIRLSGDLGRLILIC